MRAFRPGFQRVRHTPASSRGQPSHRLRVPIAACRQRLRRAPAGMLRRPRNTHRAHATPLAAVLAAPAAAAETLARFPLGAARARCTKTISSRRPTTAFVIVDQHAAHERLVFEAMRKALHSSACASQVLLIPEIVDLPEEDCDRLMQSFRRPWSSSASPSSASARARSRCRETPAMLGEIDAIGLMRQLADEIAEWDTASRFAGEARICGRDHGLPRIRALGPAPAA